MNRIKQLTIVLFMVYYAFSDISKSIGISSGLSLNKIHFKTPWEYYQVDFDTRPKAFVEIFFELSFNKYFSSQIGIEYISKGELYTYELPTAYLAEGFSFMHYDSELILNYIAIPIVCKGSVPLKKIEVYGRLGGEIGFLVRSKELTIEHVRYENSVENTRLIERDVENDLNKVEISMHVGIGVELNLNKINPFLEFVYTKGMTDIWKDDYDNDFWEDTKNSGIILRAGIKLHFKDRIVRAGAEK